jgi:hypothetical protein
MNAAGKRADSAAAYHDRLDSGGAAGWHPPIGHGAADELASPWHIYLILVLNSTRRADAS